MTTITEEAQKTWEDLVAEGVEVSNTITNRQWRLGDLAVEVAGPARGVEDNQGRGGKLAQYADEIDVDYQSLMSYRAVSTAWKSNARFTSIPWTLYRELHPREDREAKLTAFIAECEAKKTKPSYRSLQAFLGKTPTPQYTERDRDEQVRRGLNDMSEAEREEILKDFARPDTMYCKYCYEERPVESSPDGSVVQCAVCGHGLALEQPAPLPPDPKPPVPEPKAPKPAAHVTRNARYPKDAEHEWYTPVEYIEAATAVMGGIDLDPATSERANDVVGARVIHTTEDDGLVPGWHGRVWMNPPYERNLVGKFCGKLLEEYASGQVTEAIVLVNNSTDTGWFQEMMVMMAAACFPKYRIRFWHPEDLASNPLQGQAILYFGPNPDRFRAFFSDFGGTVAA